MTDLLPLSLILKIDKKDQAQPAWFFSSIIKYSKMKWVLDKLLGSLFSGFGLCDRKGRDVLGLGEFPEGKVGYHLNISRKEPSGYPIGRFVRQSARILV